MAGCMLGSPLMQYRATIAAGVVDREQEALVEAVLAELRDKSVRLSRQACKEVVHGPLTQHGEAVLLERIKYRLDRAGYPWPAVEVTWSDVSVMRQAVAADGSIPSLLDPLRWLLPAARRQRGTITALQPCSGVLKPGTITLLLGPPGSGRSSLLQVLAGRLRSGAVVTVAGRRRVRYNGRPLDSFVATKTAAYVDQVDSLLPTLTVRETLNFSEVCSGFSGHLAAALVALKAWEAAHPDEATRTPLDDEADAVLAALMQPGSLCVSEWCLTSLGLQGCGDGLVGDELLRGVSGGERRRVTVGEGLVGPAMVLLLDEASSGLDSSSTLALISSMASWARLLNTTVVMALQQPEPSALALFDDVILMSSGHTLWHGPPQQALVHLRSVCGLGPQPGQAVCDFLQQVAGAGAPPPPAAGDAADAAAGGEQQQQQQQEPQRGVDAAALGAAFWASEHGKALKAAAAAAASDEDGVPRGPPDEAALRSLFFRHMAPPWHVLLLACTKRLFRVDLARNWEAVVTRWMLAALMACVTGLLFLQLPVNFEGGISILGMLFQGLFFVQVLGLPTIEVTFAKRPILFRQRDAAFYPAWVEWLPSLLLNLPIILGDVLVYGTITYFLIGFTPTAGAFFIFMFILFCFSLVCENLYRAYGSAAKVLSFAIGIGVCQALVNEILAGFVITPGAIPAYWYWAHWLNPLAYAFRALAINEFSQARWAIPDPSAAAAIAAGGSSNPSSSSSSSPVPLLGDAVLDFLQVQRTGVGGGSWVWDGVGVLLGMAGVCGAVSLAAYTWARLPESPAVQEEDEAVGAAVGDGVKQAMTSKAAAAAAGSKAAAKQQPLQQQQQEDGGSQHDAVVIELPAAGPNTTAAAPTPAGAAAAPLSPPRGLTIAFQDLAYFVPHPNGAGLKGQHELQLLRGISGVFRPGRLTALMGASGAGKTTLLDVIAGRKTAGRVAGTITVCGLPRAATHFARLIGYCEQADIHTPLATVREALQFSAALRLQPQAHHTPGGSSSGSSSRADQVAAAVDQALQLVELAPLAGRLVGRPGVSGLSSEQRKRLTLAVELVAAPAALFLDEPTSGLDARGAALITRVMAGISATGVTVTATIHQPSRQIFGAFDELLLLARGGRQVFGGPLGPGAACLVGHLQAALPDAPAFVQNCRQGVTNPASWMMDLISGPASNLPGGPDLVALYEASEQAQVVARQVEQLSQPPADPAAAVQLRSQLRPPAAAGVVQQLGVLLARGFTAHWRDPGVNLGRFVVTVAMALIVGSIEWGKGDTSKIHDAASVHNCLGAIYMLASALAVEVAFECQPDIIGQRAPYYRERAAGCYGAGAFLLAQALVEVAYVSLQVLLYVVITFFMLGLEATPLLFAYVLALVWCACLAGFLTAQALVHTSGSPYLATTLLSVISVLQGLLGGFTRPLPFTPKAWWAAFFLNPSFYTFVGIGSQVLGELDTPIPTPTGSTNGTAPALVAVRDHVAAMYGMGRGSFPGPAGSLGMILAIVGAWLAASFVGLRWCSHQRR